MNAKEVFVIGSKPDAHFPDLEPDVVVTANAALRRGQAFKDAALLVAVMSDQVFSDNALQGRLGKVDRTKNMLADEEYLADTRRQLEGCRVDRLVLLKTLPDRRYVVDPMGFFVAPEVEVLTRWAYHRQTLRFVGFREALRVYLETESPATFLRSTWQALRYGKIDALEISTGMIAVAYTLSHFPQARIHVIGVGIEGQTASFYSDKPTYPPFHVPRDRMFARALVAKGYGDRVTFSDPVLADELNGLMERRRG